MSSSKIQYVSSTQWTDLFEVSPTQYNITCQLQKEEFLQLSIINTGNDCIAWKLKTNRPGRYMVSPKQGIIPAKERKDCTVVLSKLKTIPNSKTDKFLIQATKIDPNTDIADLPQLWKSREGVHDKKRGVYAYQSVTIKCFLNVETKSVNVIDDYVPPKAASDTTPKSQKSDKIITPTKTEKASVTVKESKASCTAKSEIESIEILDPSSKPTTEKEKGKEEKIDKNDEKVSVKSNDEQTSEIVKVDGTEYKLKTVEQWKRKAFEYDELFQFTRKTLAQRDELSARWKAETDKTRALQKLNKEMVEEKKNILSEYNKYRNENKDDADEKDEDDEKKESIDDNLLQRQDTIRELEEFEREAAAKSQGGYTISVIHIIVTLLLMYASFEIGKMYQGMMQPSEQSDDSVDDILPKDSL